MSKIIHFVQNLSLDIAIGAVISSCFLAQVLNVDISVNMLLGLAIAIWLIYTFDHLRDAYKTTITSVNPRHAFHQKYFKQLIGVALTVFFLGLYNLQFLPKATLKMGFVLVGLSGLYFSYLIYSKQAFQKEVFAATVYVAGIATAPLSLLESLRSEHIIIFLIFWLLAIANLFIIPLFEEEIDELQNESSIVLRTGRKRVQQLLHYILLLGISLSVAFLFFTFQYEAFFILLLMHLSLVLLYMKPKWFNQYQLYRILSDGIFFLPGLLLL